jgi:hypothetical protein
MPTNKKYWKLFWIICKSLRPPPQIVVWILLLYGFSASVQNTFLHYAKKKLSILAFKKCKFYYPGKLKDIGEPLKFEKLVKIFKIYQFYWLQECYLWILNIFSEMTKKLVLLCISNIGLSPSLPLSLSPSLPLSLSRMNVN